MRRKEQRVVTSQKRSRSGEAVGEQHAEHGGEKDELQEEEQRLPVAVLAVVRVVGLHVPEAVDGDEAAHDADDAPP